MKCYLWELRGLLSLMFYMLHLRNVDCQNVRKFPPLFNVAKRQPIRTEPAQSTCGVPVRNSYCRSTTSLESVYECHQEFCVQECPRRTLLPDHTDFLLDAQGYDVCVTHDDVNKHPFSGESSRSSLFLDNVDCYLITKKSPSLGANGALTVTFWMWQEKNNFGTVIDKYSTPNTMTTSSVFRVQVSSSKILFIYDTTFGQREVEFVEAIPSNVWTHVSLQVYNNRISLFLNGTSLGQTATTSKGLIGQIKDRDGTYRIGQMYDGTDQYVGRIQDIRFYGNTVTNREIDEIYTGVLPHIDIQTDCRCPPTHPRIKPLDTRYCIQNGVPDNLGDEVLRLNNESHPVQYLNDGDSSSIWVSSFTDTVSLIIDLQDLFQVFYVVLQFYSPLPKIVTVERKSSQEPDASWELWQLYAENCEETFDLENNGPLPNPASVNCIQFGTNGLLEPYSKGNITFSVLSSAPVARPGHSDFYNTPALIDFVEATQVKVSLQGHYHVSNPKHMYYGVYEYIVTGRCDCHGHAISCDTTERPYKCHCDPESFTQGNQCEACLPLYNNKPFGAGNQVNAYNCRKCECNDHATSCVYDESLDAYPSRHMLGGGGVCVDCVHNTEGQFCEICVQMYFRELGKSLSAEDVCTPCDCYPAGLADVDDLDCEKVGGQCTCKANVVGRRCDACNSGYFSLEASNPLGCDACECETSGTEDGDINCDQSTGQCHCKRNVQNQHCDTCAHGFYNLTSDKPDGCSACQCNPYGSSSPFCDPVSGQCVCKENMGGRQCDRCEQGFSNFADGCFACDCDPQGSESGSVCDRDTGQCLCKPHTTGLRCDQCQDGYYNLGADPITGCLSCGCDPAGTLEESTICDKLTGECTCKDNVEGRMCHLCKPNAYNLTLENPLGCNACGCDPSGTVSGDILPQQQLSCDHNTGQCTCLSGRSGQRCDQCGLGTYVNPELAGGCLPCDCYVAGTIRLTMCDSQTGQCQCYGGDSGITGRRCDTCKEFYFNLNPADHSCAECECDTAGSVNSSCSATTGQCFCKDFTTDRQCGQCLEGTSNLDPTNPYGCSKAPSQQPPPQYDPLSPTSLRLYWDGPDYPNGLILLYSVYRNGEKVGEVKPEQGLSFDDIGLTPFTNYAYEIEAANVHGSTRSSSVTYKTPSGPPSGTVDLFVGAITSRSAAFSWSRPTSANGVIQSYILVSQNHRDPTEVTHYRGLAFDTVITDLTPFTEYTFVLRACTGGGCLESDTVVVITGDMVPEGQGPPEIMPVSESELYVSWEPPQFPNGIIIFYELWIRGIVGSGALPTDRDPEEKRIFHPSGQYNPLPDAPPTNLPLPATNFTVVNLEPFTEYEFQVISENILGKAASAWVKARTLTAVPAEMPEPSVSPLSRSSVNVSWVEPTDKQARGEVHNYTVYHYSATDLTESPFAPPYQWMFVGTVFPPQRHQTVDGLPAYSTESFLVELCNSEGCVNSSVAQTRTLAAAPEEFGVPIVEGFNASIMELSWSPPVKLNGPMPTYVVKRTTGAFNSPPPLVSKGIRFPGTGYYKFPSNVIPQGVAFSGFELWFKTSQRDALLLFAASEGGQEEFVAIQIRAGRPWFLFDPQECTVFVTPNITETELFTNVTFDDGEWHHLVAMRQLHTAYIEIDGLYTGCSIIVTTTDDEGLPYNDNRWHHLYVTRIGQKGSIIMDGRWTGIKTEDCSTGNIIGDNSGVYVGGLPKDYNIQRQEADIRAQVIEASFQGCLRDIRILTSTSPEETWLDLDWNDIIEREGAAPEWEGCPDDLDIGYHFLGTGYVVYQSGYFNGGPVIDLQFEMRTALRSGVLFFAYGGQLVYYLVQIRTGQLYVEVRDQDVVQVLNFDHEQVNICDGNWHFVKVYKYQSSLTVTVDYVHQVSAGDRTIIARMVIASDFYIAGIQPGGEAQEFVKDSGLESTVSGSFGGCIRNIRINRRPYTIEQNTKETVNVNLDGCPAYYPSKQTCQEAKVEVIYQGPANSTMDFGRLPFTEYMYQIEAVNEAGSVVTDWTIGRTREGAPVGVLPPLDVTVLDGFTAEVSWVEPEGRTGRLVSFIIRAYNLDTIYRQPIEQLFNVTTFQGVLEGLIPFTNYSVKLEVCTNGGCTESTEGARIVTTEEAPLGVQPPYSVDIGGEYITVQWDVPEFPNGILTGYVLFMEDVELYSGAEMTYNVTDLRMYTGYRFHLRACSRVGCTNSSVTSIITTQLPPTFVEPPTLTVLGTSRIQVEWEHPVEINGALQRYLVYVSTNISSDGQVFYNSTDLFVMYILNNLTAGLTYYIKVSACTGGGCRLSEASVAQTEESAPEGVYTPIVTSPTPLELLVSWQTPKYPNGIITLYRLYHNGLMIYNTTPFDVPEFNPSSPSTPDQFAIVGQFTITGLVPYSLHQLRLEACTAKGCSSSETLEVRTAEAEPIGTIGLSIRNEGQRKIGVQYSGVDVQNGLVVYTIFVDGLYYTDAENWNYSTVRERRALHESGNQTGSWISVHGLIPYSVYKVQVNASNTAGFILSNIKQLEMPMGSPDGVKSPNLTSPNSSTVRTTWGPVGRANADQEPAFELQLRVPGPTVQIQNLFTTPTTATTYLITQLDPFSMYDFRLVASNAYGETMSPWATVTTAEDKPTQIDPPLTANAKQRGVDVFWAEPYQPNGVIVEFRLYQNNTLKETVGGNVTRVTVRDLLPFTTYIYYIEACTSAGCTSSTQSKPVTTEHDLPEGVPAPHLQAHTATSVYITWGAPRYPNTPLLQYLIERRVLGQEVTTLVKMFLVDDPKEYLDQDQALSPNTLYQYRIGVYTELGTVYGAWANVTTKSSAPGGVLAPQVEFQSPTSMLVTWEPPLQPNGRLESYIIKLPNPRFEVYNVSQLSLLISDLTPYTEYTVTLTICTDGGCTESSPTVGMTSPSLPTGISTPLPTAHSQTLISVMWQPPTEPNGPNIRYELARKKVRQPLMSDAVGFDTWTSIYSGQGTYTEDRGLTIYTTYQYRLTVYNDFGHYTSEESTEVTTFGGIPRKAPQVSAFSVNHTTIEVRWEIPSVHDLQGGPIEFILNVTGFSGSQAVSVAGDKDSAVIDDLEANTQYGIILTTVTLGGAMINSDVVYAITSDGAPEGLAPPLYYVVNDTTLRVSWTLPDRPNGEITVFYLYLDSERIHTGLSEAGSYVLQNLMPNTVYLLQVEVCTDVACVKSDAIQASTSESLPAGVRQPDLTVLGTSAIAISWMEPQQANGIILNYEVLKREMAPCTRSDDDEPVVGQCVYIECGVLESFCGDQCYSGPKTCCDGILYDNKFGYECCGKDYIPRRNNFEDICCGGQFYAKLENHECCGNRYVEVQTDAVCCADTEEDRVDIGLGDQCCGGIPFDAVSGSQICCNGNLYEKHNQQCCGGQVVSNSLQCCGGEVDGTAFKMDSRKSCCGDEYTDSATSMCCVDSLGRTKVHQYLSVSEKASSSEQCCGVERIPADQTCCHNNGYHLDSHTCGDRSEMQSGCGSSTVCPAAESSSAYCDSCEFDRTSKRCGSYVPENHPSDKADSVLITGAQTTNNDEMCLTEAMMVYNGPGFNFSDTDLTPYTEYHYAVVATNAAGSTTGTFATATTGEALPQGVKPPQAMVKEGEINRIYLSWEKPEQPNGQIIWFILQRDGVEILRDPYRLEHVDDNVIQPYRTYVYQLRVCNSVGCVFSEKVQVATLQAKPSGVSPPVVEATSPTALHVTWSEPQQTNGYIENYELHELQKGLRTNLSGAALEYIFTDLVPYGEYTFVLSACTLVGCTNSSSVTVRTMQDKPTGIAKPRFVVFNTTALEVYWSEPEVMNGVLEYQKLYRAKADGAFQAVFTSNTSTGLYIDIDIQPGDQLQYLVEIATAAGGTNSTVASVVMPSSTPSEVPAPHNVTVMSAYEIYIAWEPLTNPNVDQYKILLNAGTADEIEQGVGLDTSELMWGLTPYTEYTVRIQACLAGVNNGCGTGPAVMVVTHEAPPTDMQAPTFGIVKSTSVEIIWDSPVNSNGIIIQYKIFRRQVTPSGDILLLDTVSGESTKYKDEGVNVKPFTQFEYKLIAVNSKGETESPWVKVRTLEDFPVGMSSPEIAAIGPYSIKLSWKPPTLPNGMILSFRAEYRVLSNDPTIVSPVKYVTLLGSTLETTVSGLQPHSSYEVRVTAVNVVGSVSGAWVLFTTEQAAPKDISAFFVEKMVDGLSVILRWNAPATPNGVVNNYLIYEEGFVNAIYQGLNREFEFRRLEPFTEYTIQLEVCTEGGCTRSDWQKFTTAEISPQNQPSPTFDGVTGSEVTLKWIKPLSSNGQLLYFEIVRRIQQRLKKRQVVEDEVIYRTTDTTQSEYEYKDINLQPYTVYEYKIRTGNTAGTVESPWTPVETSQGAPTRVSAPIVSHIGSQFDRLLVQWTEPETANGIIQNYLVQRNETNPVSFAPNDAKSYTDAALQAYTYYSYTVTACTAGGCTKSLPTVFQTQQGAPDYVPPPSLQTLNSTAMFVSWIEPQTTNGEINAYQLKVDNEAVYSGQELNYTLKDLIPYQAYTFSLRVCTFGGCQESASVIGRPDEAQPSGMNPPVLRVTGSNSIEVSWKEPDQPNGIITSYELKRDGNLIQTTQGLQFVDFDVEPGQTYSYTITVFNSKGSVTSRETSATTFSSSPDGLNPPVLQPLSATVMRVTWSEPLKPNGIIYNYTLHYLDKHIVFPSNTFATDVMGLEPYTEYSFRIEACTSHGCKLSSVAKLRTLEDEPSGLDEPHVTAKGNEEYVWFEIKWEEPRRENGEISMYNLHRRNYTGLPQDMFSGSTKLVFSTTDTSKTMFEDFDKELEPFTYYEYSITAFNSAGSVKSFWAKERSAQTAPRDVPAPAVQSVTSTTITVEIRQPLKPNGVIIRYQVFKDGQQIPQYSGIKNVVVLGDESEGFNNTALKPYTKYSIQSGVCTAMGCTKSPITTATTAVATPEGLKRPTVTATAWDMNIVWSEPTKPNAPSLKYELSWFRDCPYPYADQDDEIELPCEADVEQVAVRGDDVFKGTLGGLSPYTKYTLRLSAWNDAGRVEVTTSENTEPAAPVYNSRSPPTVFVTGSVLILDWIGSFHINSEVERFVLYEDGEEEYAGSMMKHTFYRRSVHDVYEFQVQLITKYGAASSEKFIFDPLLHDINYVSTAAPAVEGTPVYKESWFIVLIAISILVVIVLILVCYFIKGRQKQPYIRERNPLEHKVTHPTPPYVISDYSNGIVSTEIPRSPGSNTMSSSRGIYPGYSNHGYNSSTAGGTLTRQPSSLMDLRLNRLQNGSTQGSRSKWDMEDTDDYEVDSVLDGFVSDSGLHSLTYGEEDFDSDRPHSVLREHMMFPDTHL